MKIIYMLTILTFSSPLYADFATYLKTIFSSSDQAYIRKMFIGNDLTFDEKLALIKNLSKTQNIEQKTLATILYRVPHFLKESPNEREVILKIFNSVKNRVDLSQNTFNNNPTACYYATQPDLLVELAKEGMEVNVYCNKIKLMDHYKELHPKAFSTLLSYIPPAATCCNTKTKTPLSRSLRSNICDVANIIEAINYDLKKIKKSKLKDGMKFAFKSSPSNSSCSAVSIFRYSEEDGFIATSSISFSNVKNGKDFEKQTKGKSIDELRYETR